MNLSQNVPNSYDAFWNAPAEALFSQKLVANVIGFSESWLERQRWMGGGIRYFKIGRKCLYRKEDVIFWLNQHQKNHSTSEYDKSTPESKELEAQNEAR